MDALKPPNWYIGNEINHILPNEVLKNYKKIHYHQKYSKYISYDYMINYYSLFSPLCPAMFGQKAAGIFKQNCKWMFNMKQMEWHKLDFFNRSIFIRMLYGYVFSFSWLQIPRVQYPCFFSSTRFCLETSILKCLSIILKLLKLNHEVSFRWIFG